MNQSTTNINNINNNDNQLASYLTGLLEGDGSISFNKNSKGIISRPVIGFTFCKNDLNFAEFLKEKFNIGKIYFSANKNYLRWQIMDETSILNLFPRTTVGGTPGIKFL